MFTRWWFYPLISVVVAALLAGCASSELATYNTLSSAEVSAKVSIKNEADRVIFRAPNINIRASFGSFTKGMMSGGSEFSSAIALQGERTQDSVTTHWLIAEVVYTNLGGVYRDYDRAGIEGIAELVVVPVSANRHYNINSVNMTEIVKIEIADSDLRAREASGLMLRLIDDSDNLVEFNVPANYIGGYLLAIANGSAGADES